MAKGKWMSEAEVQQIVHMRKDGVSVASIAKQVDRSTNYIYRVLKRVNSQQQPQPQQQHEANATTTDTSATPATATATPRSVAVPLQPSHSQPSATLLCAVESLELSAYEPIPMPRSVHNSTLPGSVSASVAFTTAQANAPKPHSDDPPEFWLLPDAESSSMAQSTESDTQMQPSKRQKTRETAVPASPSPAPTSSALTVTRQPQRPQSCS
ncbi:hypothetical protein ON010_g8059 [Phytophthora cinnamomi]|nr:hypothetical protein ON010_g8059 [Phytophthora cinnamomi]